MCLGCDVLKAENAKLLTKIEILNQKLSDLGVGIIPFSPLTFIFSPQELKLVVFLCRMAAIRSPEAISAAIYDDPYSDPPETFHGLAVIICHANRKLKPFGVKIENRHGQGYFISSAGAKLLLEILHATEYSGVLGRISSYKAGIHPEVEAKRNQGLGPVLREESSEGPPPGDSRPMVPI